MSLDSLASGRLAKSPETRTTRNERQFATAQVSVASDGDDSTLVSLIAFRAEAVAPLGDLDIGDACAVAGRAKVTTWTNRDGETKAGLSIVVEQLLTPYHVRRKRNAAQGDNESGERPNPTRAGDRGAKGRDSRGKGIPARRALPATAGGIEGMADDDPFGDGR
jgi:single-stranded DNA-binding protein